MPLDGRVDQELDVEVLIYFSGEVDPGSVTTDSVMLDSAVFDDGACGAEWTAAGLEPVVDGDRPRVVRLGGQQDLSTDMCYRISCTTGVSGVNLGPLVDLRIPGRPGIGAEAEFSTRSP